MNFPQIPEPYQGLLQLVLFAVVIYSFFRNRNKAVDKEKTEWSIRVGMGSIAFVIVSVSVIAILYGDDAEGRSLAIHNMKWISLALLLIAFSWLEYRFWRRKKRLNSQPGLKP